MVVEVLTRYFNVGLLYQRDNAYEPGVIDYVDSDCTGDLDRQRSITGYIFH